MTRKKHKYDYIWNPLCSAPQSIATYPDRFEITKELYGWNKELFPKYLSHDESETVYLDESLSDLDLFTAIVHSLWHDIFDLSKVPGRAGGKKFAETKVAGAFAYLFSKRFQDYCDTTPIDCSALWRHFTNEVFRRDSTI